MSRMIWIALIAVATGCGASVSDAFKAQAATDLSCEERELLFPKSDEPKSQTAEGCGKLATYVQECDHQGCRWSLQSLEKAPRPKDHPPNPI